MFGLRPFYSEASGQRKRVRSTVRPERIGSAIELPYRASCVPREGEWARLRPSRLSGPRFSRGVPFRRSGRPAFGGRFVRRTVQHDEVGNLPRKGRLLASLGLSLVSVVTPLRGRSSVSLPPVPGDDNGKLSGLPREPVEASQRSAADDDTDRLLRRRFGRCAVSQRSSCVCASQRNYRQRSFATLPPRLRSPQRLSLRGSTRHSELKNDLASRDGRDVLNRDSYTLRRYRDLTSPLSEHQSVSLNDRPRSVEIHFHTVPGRDR